MRLRRVRRRLRRVLRSRTLAAQLGVAVVLACVVFAALALVVR